MILQQLIAEKKKKELMSFIRSREQSNGGFSFSQSTPPTLEDTYFALRLLEELKQYSVSKQTVFYIAGLNRNEFPQPKHLYQLTIIYRIIHNVELEDSIRNKITNMHETVINNLSDLYYMVSTKELLMMSTTNLIKNEKNILSSAQKKQVKSMEEYKQLIILMKKLNITLPAKEYIRIIQNSQNPDGAFGIVPNSTSYLEPTYHALRGLRELHVFPNDIYQCERFIDSCMANIGGYGRQTITVPTLEYSYYALMSLKIIEEMKKDF